MRLIAFTAVMHPTPAKIDGLGLGLSICMEIAKIHHGRLSLSVTDRQTVLVTLTAATMALSS